MENYPNLEVITCSPSVYKRTSNTYIEALSQLDIEVRKKYNWGAKSQTDGIEFKVLVLKFLKSNQLLHYENISILIHSWLVR